MAKSTGLGASFMRSLFLRLALVVGLAGAGDVGMCRAQDHVPVMTVGVDHVVHIRLWGPASTVVVGNPAIADVNLVNGRSLVITGHAVGQTSIMVLDRAGQETFHQTVVVGAGDAGHVAVQRGAETTDYSCAPRCERASSVPSRPAASVALP